MNYNSLYYGSTTITFSSAPLSPQPRVLSPPPCAVGRACAILAAWNSLKFTSCWTFSTSGTSVALSWWASCAPFSNTMARIWPVIVLTLGDAQWLRSAKTFWKRVWRTGMMIHTIRFMITNLSQTTQVCIFKTSFVKRMGDSMIFSCVIAWTVNNDKGVL